MPIVTNDNQEEDVVLSELKDKLSVEAKLKTSLRKFFKTIVNDQKVENNVKSIKKKGINVQQYAPQLTNLLNRSYNEAIDKASGCFMDDPIVQDLLSPQERTMIKGQSVLLSQEYASKRAVTIAEELMATTRKNLAQSHTLVDKVILQTGVEVTQAERMSMVMDNFEQRLNNRVGTIAATETQNVYQEAKQIEARMTNEVLNRSGQNMQKRWNATLDQSTRPAHVEAHGQRVNLEALYEVWGEKLSYPGDDSNGASVKNLANCRCESIHVIIQ